MKIDDEMTGDAKNVLILSRIAGAIAHLPTADKQQAIDWMDAGITSTDSHVLAVMELLLNEEIRITRMVNGEPMLKLTERGEANTLERIEKSPALRKFLEQLSGRSVVDPPKRTQ
jgi:hypothetical protein